MKISQINLKIIRDSRGEDTLGVEMTSGNLNAVSSVPAGKSKGKHEMVSVAPPICLQKLAKIKNEMLNADFSQIQEFDNFLMKLDGTPNKSNLGGNLILVLSICFTKLFAKANNLQTYQLIAQILGRKPEKFPYLFFNLIGGGLHAKDSLPFQEYILVTKFNSPASGLKYAELTVERLRLNMIKKFGYTRFGDEGAFAIKSNDPALGLEILSGYLDNPDVGLALDVAASTFYSNGKYRIGEKSYNAEQMLDLYQGLAAKFPLLSIEDPFSEDDEEGFTKICEMFKDKSGTESVLDKIWIIGDDLTATNKELIRKAQDKKQITGVIIKPNQIGTVTETLEAIKLAQSYGLKTIVSHRSGETDDNFIADLAYGASADGLKSGAPTQPQRLAKYNRLIEIERQLDI